MLPSVVPGVRSRVVLLTALLLSTRHGGTAADSDSTADLKLAEAREVNLEYVSHMPDFVADEKAKRYTSNNNSRDWRYSDTIETEISFRGSRAVRGQIRRDGKPWKQPFEALPGFKWSGGFGTEIRPLFDPACPTTIAYEGPAEIHGKQLHKYRFSSPADGCFAFFYIDSSQFNPGRTGYAFLDDGGHLIELEETADGFPADFEFTRRTEHVTWDYVKIGNDSHLLPVAATFEIFYSSGLRSRIEVEYRNHRHFEASTNVDFH
jgi:hypothetical protein